MKLALKNTKTRNRFVIHIVSSRQKHCVTLTNSIHVYKNDEIF